MKRAAWAIAVLWATVLACDPVPGSPCTEDADCGSGLMCARPTIDGGPAAKGVCSPNLTSVGGRCTVNEECVRGLFCSNDLSAEVKRRYGTCIARQNVGARCYRDLNCETNLVCRKLDNAETGLCAPMSEPPDAAPPDGGTSAFDGA